MKKNYQIIYLKIFVLGSDIMRMLEINEKNKIRERIYLIQGIELEFIKKLQIPTPKSIEKAISKQVNIKIFTQEKSN